MKNKIFFWVVMVAALSCGCSQIKKGQQKVEARQFWTDSVMPAYLQNNSTILHVQHIRARNTSYENSYHFDYLQTPLWQAYLNTEWDVYCRADSSKITVVNPVTRELTVVDKDGDAGWNAYQQYLLHEFLFPIVNPSSHKAKWLQFVALTDSVIDGTAYKVVHAAKKDMLGCNPVTGEYDVPLFFDVYYCFNPLSRQVERVVCQPMDTTVNYLPESEYIIRFEPLANADSAVQDLFDLESPRYAGYSRHDDAFPPFSWRWNTGDSNVLSPEVLAYPLHNLDGTTTTLRQQQGWMLVDFWMFNCPACRKQMLEWEKERTDNGITVLERAGIHILPVNATSDNTALLAREDSICCSARHRLFHAKGIGRYIFMQNMPQYYLILPDKKIVYQTQMLGDYSDLLKAMRDYQQNKQAKK